MYQLEKQDETASMHGKKRKKKENKSKRSMKIASISFSDKEKKRKEKNNNNTVLTRGRDALRGLFLSSL